MARDIATIQVVSASAGRNVVFTAFVTSNGGQYDNVLQTGQMVFNNGAGNKIITISTDKAISPQDVAMPDFTFTVPANAVAFRAPILLNQWWAQDGTTNIFVDADSDTDLDWAVIREA